jgi:succinoglycan biosynthesis transport protein ExoP
MSAATTDTMARASAADPLRPELGALMATLAMMMADRRAVVLHVTSSRHGEGTTTVARELAAAAARAPWCRVALVDAAPASMDCTLPSLLGAFERGHDPALRPARIGGAEIAVGRLTNLGEGTPRLETLRGLFAWTRSEFALVVVDNPPVLPCREAAIAAAVADGTLLVVQAESARRSEIVQAHQILDQLGAKMLGVVLNKRRRRVPRFVERLL